jgi:hypothetical protein
MPESHLAQVGVGVRWGQAGSDFQLQNGLMQSVLLIFALMLGCTPTSIKRSQSTKVEQASAPLPQDHPKALAGAT